MLARRSRRQTCTELILAAGIARVVFALREPPLFADCDGAELLARAGVEVVELPDAGRPRSGPSTPTCSAEQPPRRPSGCDGAGRSTVDRPAPDAGTRYLFSSDAFFSTSSIPPQRKNACSGRWS